MSKPDEKAIERDFCAGVLSLQAVADKHGITVKALRYMAGKKGWIRAKGARAKQGQKSGAKKHSERAPKIAPTAGKLQATSAPLSSTKNITDVANDLVVDPEEFGLSEKQASFVYWFLVTKNRVEAYRRAGYQCEGNTVYPAASQVYRNIKVARAIRVLSDRFMQRYSASLDEVVAQLVAITKADPNALTQYRRVNCRRCWGENHLYQWRDIAEFDKAAAKASKDGKPEPEYGGLGFSDNNDPDPDCPHCQGEGEGQLFFADTRDLCGTNERWIYAGVKKTKDGIEILMHDQAAARRDLLRLIVAKEKEKTPGQPHSLEEDYQLQALTPDEPIPEKPIL